jgi:dihydroorotase
MLIKTLDNKTINVDIKKDLSGKNIIAIPSVIDPHVHFRTPGQEYKENWISGAKAAINGGVCTVIDMPNNNPSIIDKKTLEEKKQIIESQLKETGINLNYFLYIGATEDNLEKIENLKNEIVAVKMFMGSSTGNLLIEKKEIQEKVFALCKKINIPLAVHAEDENTIIKNMRDIKSNNIEAHSKIRSKEAAIKAVSLALELAQKYETTLYILHISTKEEVELIKKAKKNGVKVFAEATPHHLFLTEDSYKELNSKAQMNPPLRSAEDMQALWQGIEEGIIDTIGSDHAPHILEEKFKNYPESPSGVPGIETLLPLLIDRYNQGKINLKKIVELTHTNPKKIFNIKISNCFTIIDLDLEQKVCKENLKTKCGWSPFEGQTLKGCPIYTVINKKIFKIK